MKKGIALFISMAMVFMVCGISGYVFAEDPFIIGTADTPGRAMNVYVSGSYAYVASGD
jgi:hypothetical protein